MSELSPKAAIVLVSILACGILFTFNSTYGTTNVTAGVAEQHVMENHYLGDDNNNNTYGTSSSTTSSSQLSPYAGQQVRDIKSLSDEDVQSLQNGTGEAFGGMAKLAELNGYPGPRHVLDLASELRLTDGQRIEIESIYQNMSNNAKGIGAAIIDIEQDMNGAFANKAMTQENLKLMLKKSADLYGQLRLVHLSAHLDTVQILTMEQVQMYNTMRGYDGSSSEYSGIRDTNNNNSSSHHQHLAQ